jgi:hypothetical protein
VSEPTSFSVNGIGCFQKSFLACRQCVVVNKSGSASLELVVVKKSVSLRQKVSFSMARMYCGQKVSFSHAVMYRGQKVSFSMSGMGRGKKIRSIFEWVVVKKSVSAWLDCQNHFAQVVKRRRRRRKRRRLVAPRPGGNHQSGNHCLELILSLFLSGQAMI